MDIRECAKAIDLDLESIACLGRSIKVKGLFLIVTDV